MGDGQQEPGRVGRTRFGANPGMGLVGMPRACSAPVSGSSRKPEFLFQTYSRLDDAASIRATNRGSHPRALAESAGATNSEEDFFLL